MHHETNARFTGAINNFLRLFESRGKWLLTNHVDAEVGCYLTHFQMRWRRRDNIHEVRFFLLQHFAVVCVVPGNAVLVGDLFCTVCIAVAEGRYSDFRNALPGLILKVTEIPRPDSYALERTH